MTGNPAVWKLEGLSHDSTTRLLARLAEIDSGTAGEPWTESNWLLDVPGKWQLSRVARGPDDSVAGFLIASLRGDAVHIHRIAVASAHRGGGLGTAMLRDAARSAMRVGRERLSLKVDVGNAPARRLYERLGFTVIEESGSNFLMMANCFQVLSETRAGSPAG